MNRVPQLMCHNRERCINFVEESRVFGMCDQSKLLDHSVAYFVEESVQKLGRRWMFSQSDTLCILPAAYDNKEGDFDDKLVMPIAKDTSLIIGGSSMEANFLGFKQWLWECWP